MKKLERIKSNNCPIEMTLEIIGGKWSLWILWSLSEKTFRYGELKKAIPGITEKMLIQTLKHLEEFKVITRTEYPQVPPKVEYSLTNQGKKLVPLLKHIEVWGCEHLEFINEQNDNDD